MPPVYKITRASSSARLISFRGIVVAAAVGIGLSLTSFYAVEHLHTTRVARQQVGEHQRQLRLVGDHLTRRLKQQLLVAENVALRFERLPRPRDNRFSLFAEEVLSGVPDLYALLWFKLGGTGGAQLHRAYPLHAAAQFAGTRLPPRAAGAEPSRTALGTLPLPEQPDQEWMVFTVAPRDAGAQDRLVGVVNIDRIVTEAAGAFAPAHSALRLLLPADGKHPARFLHFVDAPAQAAIQSIPLPIDDLALQLDLITPPVPPEGADRGAWIALGSGVLLTLIGLSYLTVLQRNAVRHARLLQAQGKRLAQHVRREVEQDVRLKSKAIEASYNGIVISDAARARQPIVYVNEASERLTGYNRDELIGRSPDLLLAHEKNQPAMIRLRSALKRGEAGAAAVRCYRKDGTMFWNELSISPVTDGHGQITHFLAVMSDITERKRFADQLLHQATHDQLTGLPNRNLMQDRLHQAIAHARRFDGICGVLLINVDRLKSVNESLGHRFGNQVLKSTAELLTRCARGIDTVARLSGDEFVVILPQIRESGELGIVAQRLLDGFSQSFQIEGHELKVTCSIGGSVYPKDGDDSEALLRTADIALGRAKQKGKNRFEFFTQEMNINAAARLRMEAELRHAVENGELLLHYQPRVDLSHGRVTGVEALVRWQHPDRGEVPPTEFIPLAEETGLIPHIGDWVLHAACRQLHRWQAAGLRHVSMAVNISALQLQRSELPGEIANVIKECGVDPRFLELELTESMVMDNAADSVTTLAHLKELGVILAMDDFGTGYSSLAYLRRFPFDYLKIDRSFIANLTREPHDASIARTIIAMAHSLRLKVIAEGVETEAQARYLQRHHCDEIQGFLFSPPLPAADITQLLMQGRTLFDATPVQRGAQRTVLIVDDQAEALGALRRVLRREGYRILSTPSALEGLDLLASEGAEVVISDQRMPEMTGVEFLSRVRELHPDTIRIELTGSTDIQAAAELINRGAIFRFLTKPCDDDELRRNVREAFQHYDSQRLQRASGES